MKKLYVIAGEPSGDFLGACVLRKLEDTDFEVFGIGGQLMETEGLKSLIDISEISIGGLVEIIPHIIRIKKLINKTVSDIQQKNPDILLTIDSPGFCFRIAEKTKRKNPNIKLVHFVAPSVWAWRENRAQGLAKLYDHLLTLFDFEPKYFEKHGLKTTFVGHPAIEYFETTSSAKTDTLLLLPGSRKQEIETLLPIFLKAAQTLNFREKIIATLPTLVNTVKPIVKDRQNIKVVFDETEKRNLYQTSKFALVASGTATLQLALSGCPMIVCYKLSNLTYHILKRFVKVSYISLVNLILNRPVVPELIQSECTADKIVETFNNLDMGSQTRDFKDLAKRLKPEGCTSCEKIVRTLKEIAIAP